MYGQEQERQRSRDDETRVNIGIVIGFTLERWLDLRTTIEVLGGTVHYYRIAPPGLFLKVVEEPLPSRERSARPSGVGETCPYCRTLPRDHTPRRDCTGLEEGRTARSRG